MRFVESYTFTPGIRGAGTIVIPEVVELEGINRIWNVTKGALIYEATKSEYGIISIVVANGETTLTIETNTSTMNAGDDIQILLYDGDASGGGAGGGVGDGRIDAFGRQRVSEPFTIADYKHVYALHPEFITEKSGAGSDVAFVSNIAAERLTVGTGATDFVVRQSRMYHPYQPGKSQLILISFKLNGTQANADKRVGYFDDRNGVFLLYDDAGELYFVERRYVTGSSVDFPVAQSAWNVDPCDGTGPSGFDVNVSTTQLMFIDFQWLGVGRVRIGFVHDGAYILAHEFYHSNTLTTVYWSNPALPVRAEIRNTGALAAAASLDCICSSVQAEGGYSEAGFDFSAQTEVRAIGNPPNTLPVMAIRLADTFKGDLNRVLVRLGAIQGYSATGGYRLDVIRLDSHTQLTSTDPGGIVWTSANAESAVEYSTNVTTYTPAATDQVIDSYFVVAGGGASRPIASGVADPSAARLSFLAQDYDSNNSQAFVVFATSLGNGSNAAITMQWRELP
jgi:hypothetical protein